MINKAQNSMEQLEALKNILNMHQQDTVAQLIDMIQENFKVMDIQNQILYQELQDVRSQLKTMQQPRQPRIQKLYEGAKKNVNELGAYVANMKKSIGEKCAQAIEDFKAHGTMALDNIIDKLGIKEIFKKAEKYYNNKVQNIQKSINTIDTVSNELNAVKTHKQNIKMALKGQELLSTPDNNMNKLLAVLRNLLVKSLNHCTNCAGKLHDIVVNIEKFELKALDTKLSVNKKISAYQEEAKKEGERKPETEKATQKESHKREDKDAR